MSPIRQQPRISRVVDYTNLFLLVDAGEGRWVIKHAITESLAGTLMRTSQGLVLRDETSRFLGTFPTVEVALRNLYALV
jgi:hypothetical protein